VSPRTRVAAIVGAVAALAAGAVVGITALSDDRPPPSAPVAVSPQRAGPPPLSLDLGVRTDREAVDLRRALALYGDKQLQQASVLFRRHGSLEARVGQAYADWPGGTVNRLTELAGLHPKSAVVQLNLGTALFWSGQTGSKQAWQAAAVAEPDTDYAVVAGNLLYPAYAPKLPIFVPSERAPTAVTALQAHPARQFALLARRARAGGLTDLLFYGVALQGLGRQLSAERIYARAARAAPSNPEAQVAAAVGRFDKSQPAAAFSRLGPLTRRFPRSATVRFHLGLLLLWSGQLKDARRQLELARTVEPGSPLAREAKRYLDRLAAAGI
jgi:tetratricopeptide (TPR) repeat protein